MSLFEILGYIFMVIGVILIAIGIIGLHKYRDFYIRATIASLIDTAGFISVAFGLLLHHKLSFFTLKIGIIIVLMLLLNPLATHTIVRSAYLSGHEEKEEDKDA
ncbi:MAG: cation:proton antiporter [Firmicutes bacterium HGW-Firmicutes-1]|jgi:multicomponent Na+:H+ antiporter subunit G|nr:MAG: cation:proton antiporter [Firmicutes bacterium HGW-Firmicutes-1]